MNDKPSYFSILPADVRYDNSLTSLEKLLYSEITALANCNGICFADNQYFANLFIKNISTISRNIKNLEKKQYITITYQKRGSQIVKRSISVSIKNQFTNDVTNDKNVTGSNDKNVKDNNININNKRKYIKEKKKFGSLENVLLTEEEFLKLQDKFKDDLNDKIENLSLYISSTGKKYASHYATILNWDRKEKKNERTKKSDYEQL